MALEEQERFMSLITEITFFITSLDRNSKAELELVPLITRVLSVHSNEDWLSLRDQIRSCKPKMEFVSLTHQIVVEELDEESEVVLSLITQIMFLVGSMDLDSESELLSLIKKIISLFNSKPDSKSELFSLVTKTMSLGISAEQTQESELVSLISQLVHLKPGPGITYLIREVISRFKSMNWVPTKLISLSPQVMVTYVEGRFHLMGEEVQPSESKNGECPLELESIEFWRSTGKDYFYCQDCHGQYHEKFDKAPLEVKVSLHPEHSLQLVLWSDEDEHTTRVCCCCDECLQGIFYYCTACDWAMNVVCVEKQPVKAIDYSGWHEHSLALFMRQTPLTCNLCAMADLISPSYMCPPCGFVVHQTCLSLPRVIRISRHPHRISFTPCFDQGDRYCAICRRDIDNAYGGYSCIKDCCSYAAHSRCATRSDVWDGIKLEGVPEEIEEEETEPFVRIGDGIIQHFSHQEQHHHLRLDKNPHRDYDENKHCQACITPIYSGNFYSCSQCNFILHEDCANLPHGIYHPIHPHTLTLVGGYDGAIDYDDKCSACRLVCTSGFFYKCVYGEEECDRFKLHVQCATTSEPLVHGSHFHPLFLTSKPGEERECSVCKESLSTKKIFNCIECECEFALCFACATIPQKVRYTDDEHMLTLYYGEEPTKTFWCEECEEKINPKERFYKCDEYCCVTIHMKCLIGKDVYMKPGLLLRDSSTGTDIKVMSIDHQIARPFCSQCKKRCPQKIVFESSGLVFCSLSCCKK